LQASDRDSSARPPADAQTTGVDSALNELRLALLSCAAESSFALVVCGERCGASSRRLIVADVVGALDVTRVDANPDRLQKRSEALAAGGIPRTRRAPWPGSRPLYESPGCPSFQGHASASGGRFAAQRLKIEPIVTGAPPSAIRVQLFGIVQGVGYRQAARHRAGKLGLLGWVRNLDDGTVLVHAEGPSEAIETFVSFLREGLPSADVRELRVEETRVEGHEQFAIRGVSAGAFVVRRGRSPDRFVLALEVFGTPRTWVLPKGPSMDPSVKRMAIEIGHEVGHRDDPASSTVWDDGHYEQGGRVPWPLALERGHAVFVLHGQKLHGGFALQRTRPAPKAQWLLIKRSDEQARPGSDVLAE
jgi:acylphosphatase